MAQETDTVSSTKDVFAAVREMAIEFRFMPGAKINETDLAHELGVSRTPVREALNRLVTEELIDFKKNYGFYCRKLDLKDVLHLVEAYKTFHLSILPLVFERAAKGEVERCLRPALRWQNMAMKCPLAKWRAPIRLSCMMSRC
ncbi:GntR family transcriptional regulator [uncultured Cohaesibacter sp.]|uniref:GntR family transcriptional regulator n=1 Tax=uncultured Cohaesibacter sp. TaxID=1002546 RepID=UPI002AAC2787|nr:GntR family transcriptional regulator [uncultured Cohaesibacter sp.]